MAVTERKGDYKRVREGTRERALFDICVFVCVLSMGEQERARARENSEHA